MNQQVGNAKHATYPQPLIGYRMWGVPCAECGLPMDGIWLFHEGLEVWHIGMTRRCFIPYAPARVFVASREIRKPDGRKLPRKYSRCRYCNVRYAITSVEEQAGNINELCKSCRNQQGLFDNDEITRLQADISPDSE